MPIIRAVTTFQGISGEAEDRFQNVWHFLTEAAPVSSDYAAIGAALNRFYCADSGVDQTNPLRSYYAGDAIAGTPTPSVTYYTIASGGEAGSPEATSDLLGWGTTPSTIELPHEVALCLSFHSDLEGVPEEEGLNRPASRARGRLYLGPLNTTALGGEGRPAPVFRLDVLYAAFALVGDSELAGRDIQWAIYSRTDHVARPVVGGFVDDAFDTQRRRGVAPSGRYVF